MITRCLAAWRPPSRCAGRGDLLGFHQQRAQPVHAVWRRLAEADLVVCLDRVTHAAARLMRLPDYGIAAGAPADLVAFDAAGPAEAVATLAQPLWGIKRGRSSFTRSRPILHQPRRSP